MNQLGFNTLVHGSNARNLSTQLSLTQLAKTLFLPIYAYVFSSAKLQLRAERVLPGSEGGGGMRRGQKRRAGGRNDPNNLHT
jgi:hypothetical protein